VVVLPARLLRDKGVYEFAEAARRLKSDGISARFVLVGDIDPENPSSLSEQQLKVWSEEGVIECWGWRTDMISVFSQANLVCLPSYREGLPKSLLEAAACGRAIVTTDVPGCREVVRHEYNGILVPPRNSFALAESLKLLLENPSLRMQMGIRGRQRAESEFSSERVIGETLAVYG
jgi:glycosyltransferase involved in cell wall biosynthesis